MHSLLLAVDMTDNHSGDKRDTILDGLLDACVVNLQSQGMKKMFLDGITEGASDLLQLGKRKAFSTLVPGIN